MDSIENGPIPTNCPNCGIKSTKGVYCSNCGQKNKSKKLNLEAVLGEFFSVFFNLDNQFFRTLKRAIYPSKLASDFSKGVRKKHLHPLRFFFYSWLLFAFVSNLGDLGNIIEIELKNDLPSSNSFLESYLRQDQKDTTSLDLNNLTQENVFFNIKSFRGQSIRIALDSAHFINQAPDLYTYITLSDFQDLAPDSIYQKYNITHWQTKFALSRIQRFDKAHNNLPKYLSSHFIWLVFGLIPFYALWLKFLFFRSKKYYVEHVIYLLYLFALFFVFLFFLIIFDEFYIPFLSNLIMPVIIIGSILYSYFSFKTYYQLTALKGLFKWLLYQFGNIILFVFIFSIYLLVSILVF